MFLLNRIYVHNSKANNHCFTSQYVSIKSHSSLHIYATLQTLHPNMFLLNPLSDTYTVLSLKSLHPNMFLLNPGALGNTWYGTTLHPNMFLLNRFIRKTFTLTRFNFTSQYVSIKSNPTGALAALNHKTLHPNMFLLNRLHIFRLPFCNISLHPNMFLLNLKLSILCHKSTKLYIPICFY